MVENSSSSVFLPVRFGSLILLILCLNSVSSQSAENIETPTVQGEGLMDDISEDGTFQNISVVNEHSRNNTEHKGFLHGFVESISVILVSELGDKTFFIAAILAMSNNKLTVFLGAISALAVMTVLSALLGFAFTQFIPRIYTYYACTAIMFLFGIKMLWEAWRMKGNEMEEVEREVEEEIAARRSSGEVPTSDPEAGQADQAEISEHPETEALQGDGDAAISGAAEAVTAKQTKKSLKDKVQIRENSWFGKKCVKLFRVFTNCFAMTFLAEWGDRSQLATIVLAGVNDVAGVCVGGTMGHFICTGLAVICGALIAKRISVRTVTIIGALVFIGLAVASLFIDPYEENHLVPDVQGDDHNATMYLENNITFVESTTIPTTSTTILQITTIANENDDAVTLEPFSVLDTIVDILHQLGNASLPFEDADLA